MNRKRKKNGYTLLEILIASSVSGLLIASLGTAFLLAGKSAELHNSNAAKASVASRELMQVHSQIGNAISIKATNDSLEMLVSDQEGDGLPENITYRFQNKALQRSVDFSSTQTDQVDMALIERLEDFRILNFSQSPETIKRSTSVSSGNKLLDRFVDEPAATPLFIAFIIGDQNPSAEEALRASFFESFGHTVSYVPDSTSDIQAFINGQNSDVIFVSPEVDATIGGNIKDIDVGIVCENMDLAESLKLGIVSDSSHQVINGTDLLATSPITSAISGRFHPLFEDVISQEFFDKVTPAAEILCKTRNELAAFKVEKGKELYSGENRSFQNIGRSNVSTNFISVPEEGGNHVALKVETAFDYRVFSLSALVYCVSKKQISLGIYDDDQGKPGSLIAESGTKDIAQGVAWRTFDLDPDVDIEKGTYWLALAGDGVFVCSPSTGDASVCLANSTQSSGSLESQWPSLYTSQNDPISMVATVKQIEIARHRRVQLPFGSTSTEFNDLTDESLVLVRESLNWAAQNPVTAAEKSVSNSLWYAIRLAPELPSNATSWSVDDIHLSVRPNMQNQSATLQFRLMNGASGTNGPGQEIIAESMPIDVSGGLNELSWQKVPLTSVSKLSPTASTFIVVKGNSSSPDAFLRSTEQDLVTIPNSKVFQSTNQGVSWTAATDVKGIHFYLHGSYKTVGVAQW